MDGSMRVLVIGAGVGGLAVAKGLLDQGHDVLVYEHAPVLRDGGAGLTLWSNGTTALRQLGISVADVGRELHRLRSLNDSGRLLWEADLDAVTERLGSPTVQVPRRALVAKLAAALPREVLRFGRRCTGVTEYDQRVVARFADGETVEGDLVIGADGQRSVVRQEVLGMVPPRATGWASWQGLTRSDLPVAQGSRTLNIAGRYAHCGLIPAGNGLLHWWFDLPWREGQAELSVADLRQAYRGWPFPVPELLADITDADIGFFPHVRHRVPKVWGGARSTLIGDAVHAMPPAVAQAANQTLEDAWLLSRTLSGETAEPGPLLRRFEQQRQPRVAKISRTAAFTSAQRSTPFQRLIKFPMSLATRSQVATLRSGSNVLHSLTPRTLTIA